MTSNNHRKSCMVYVSWESTFSRFSQKEKNRVTPSKSDKNKVDIPGCSIMSRVTIEVDVVVSSPARNSSILIVILIIDRPKARERELAKFDAHRRP